MGAYGADEAWSALGDPTRRAIVACLAERPRAVGELADALPISRPAVSQALAVLKAAGLVTDRAAGTRRIYRLDPAGVAALRDQLDTYWNRALAGYQDAVASPDAADPDDAPGAGGEHDVPGAPGQERP
ncbi:ArsR/SmtB family transcription factor [Geodermatophilus sp. URMC 64]